MSEVEKPTQAQKIRRVNEVRKMLVSGFSRGEIVQKLTKKWNVIDRTIDNYIQDAKEELKPLIAAEKDNQLGIAIARMTDIYREAMDAKDHRAAIAAQQELNKLFGLYAPVKTETELSGAVSWRQLVEAAQEAVKDEPIASGVKGDWSAD